MPSLLEEGGNSEADLNLILKKKSLIQVSIVRKVRWEGRGIIWKI